MVSIDAKVRFGLFLVKKYLVDTTDADDESQFWLGWDVGIAVGLGLSLAGDQVALGLGVLLGVSGGALDDGTALEDAGLLGVLLGLSLLLQAGEGFDGAVLLLHLALLRRLPLLAPRLELVDVVLRHLPFLRVCSP